ncbi:MAG: hypothetical protein WCE21_00290 [Candidatus Babeliales bacterium]
MVTYKSLSFLTLAACTVFQLSAECPNGQCACEQPRDQFSRIEQLCDSLYQEIMQCHMNSVHNKLPDCDKPECCRKGIIRPEICEEGNCVCIKVHLPSPIDTDKVDVCKVKGTAPDNCCLRVRIPCQDCMIEMVIDESCMIMSQCKEQCASCEQTGTNQYSVKSARMLHNLPCKVCLHTADITAEYCKEDNCLCVRLPKAMPEIERIPVCCK